MKTTDDFTRAVAGQHETSPPAVYALLFVGTTGLIGFATLLIAILA